MKKEIRERVADFKNRASELYVKLDKNNTNQEADHKMMQVRGEVSAWLESFVEITADMSQEKQDELANMILDAHYAIMFMSRQEANFKKKTAEYAKNCKNEPMTKLKALGDLEQIVALAEMSACEKVRKIERFNKKINRKNFLNIVICKFKKSKSQTQECEKGSEEPVKINHNS